ncbi:MAG: HEPN domain-containing protein [Oscillospiraceae bacterium]|nr:HEPN domain-containing protein [Oscillospiraceae bacterium]
MDSLVAEWIKFSDTDLIIAKHLYDTLKLLSLETICYHCQQSAEKILKAYLINSKIKPAKTHDLILLRAECEKIGSSFAEIADECIDLNDYSSQPRYPFEIQITENLALSAIQDSEKINEFVKEKIN